VFSRPTQYAVRAMTYLASQPPGKLSGAQEVATAEKIPAAFLWKILHRLAQKKLIRSFKGVRGGYELARPARRITLAQVTRATEHRGGKRQCLLGFPKCDGSRPCPLHEVETKLRSALQRTTLADVAKAPRPAASRKLAR